MSEEMRQSEIDKFGREAYEAIESIFTSEELMEQRIEEQIDESERRMIYNMTEMRVSYANRRVSDIKGNARVILPKKAKRFDIEANQEMLRTECMHVFKQRGTNQQFD